MGLFAHSWKLPAYSGAFLVTVDNFFGGKVRLIRALRDCKQRSLTVSKKALTLSKKASPDSFRYGEAGVGNFVATLPFCKS